jgi:hypothetical protein
MNTEIEMLADAIFVNLVYWQKHGGLRKDNENQT